MDGGLGGDYKELMLIKASTPPTILCRDMPIEFSKIMEYIMDLDGHSEPDYVYIESLL
jgi:hypothetical protein